MVIINQKSKNFFHLEFFNKMKQADYTINWFKGYEYGATGGIIKRNTEYIMINKFGNVEPNKKHYLFETEYFHTYNSKRKAFEKNIGLYKKLLLFCNASYVLDPFAGSYNSAKACKELGIKIDACDKYLDPPSILRKDLFHYIEK